MTRTLTAVVAVAAIAGGVLAGGAAHAAPADADVTDVAFFEGDWKLVPSQPHSYTVMTFDDEGNVYVEPNLVTRPWAGTVADEPGGTYLVELYSLDGEADYWAITLTPTADPDVMHAAYEGDDDATLERLS